MIELRNHLQKGSAPSPGLFLFRLSGWLDDPVEFQ